MFAVGDQLELGEAVETLMLGLPLIGPIMTNSTGPIRQGREGTLIILHLCYPPAKDFVIIPRYRHVLMLSLEQGDR